MRRAAVVRSPADVALAAGFWNDKAILPESVRSVRVEKFRRPYAIVSHSVSNPRECHFQLFGLRAKRQEQAHLSRARSRWRRYHLDRDHSGAGRMVLQVELQKFQ